MNPEKSPENKAGFIKKTEAVALTLYAILGHENALAGRSETDYREGDTRAEPLKRNMEAAKEVYLEKLAMLDKK
jgi:hypothetical protein